MRLISTILAITAIAAIASAKKDKCKGDKDNTCDTNTSLGAMCIGPKELRYCRSDHCWASHTCPGNWSCMTIPTGGAKCVDPTDPEEEL
ncbi:hypothetical protein CC86DRAFT_369842 [Ophiobolus disseminans]|uniref:Uncharacterized protein n=1 Tax=Ophiobolus disseminans TaxID=1469910 RepID=A0A6A7A1J9_9PLEO|nr:hypothetical protein CC86DRAFT_369842 [Ophiobolus disseminans]